MKFSEALEEYLALRDQGPREEGYTDKAYYRRMQELLDIMDALAPLPEPPPPPPKRIT